jgi:hypothetical protein
MAPRGDVNQAMDDKDADHAVARSDKDAGTANGDQPERTADLQCAGCVMPLVEQ